MSSKIRWITLTGYEEVTVGFEPIRNGELF